MKHRLSRHQGFTLPELVVVSGTLALLSAATFPSMVRYYEDQKLNQASSELQNYLLRARSLAQRDDASCTITFSASSVTPLAGSSCSRLSSLNLATSNAIRDFCLSRNGGLGKTCTPVDPLVFTARGMLAGANTTMFVTSGGTTMQYCLSLTLSMIRLGSRNSSSDTCNYVRS